MLKILITIMMCVLVGFYGFIGYTTYMMEPILQGYVMVGLTVMAPLFGFAYGWIWYD